MPLPFILGAGAMLAGATGVGSGIHGTVKMREADVIKKEADSCYKSNIAKLEKCNKSTGKKVDELGMLELSILNGFKEIA